MPLVKVKLAEGLCREAKRDIAARLTDVIVAIAAPP
jgi:phenylpyruvate tautomerase PptA (4-oxalocrotonate tautomerase family)